MYFQLFTRYVLATIVSLASISLCISQKVLKLRTAPLRGSNKTTVTNIHASVGTATLYFTDQLISLGKSTAYIMELSYGKMSGFKRLRVSSSTTFFKHGN